MNSDNPALNFFNNKYFIFVFLLICILKIFYDNPSIDKTGFLAVFAFFMLIFVFGARVLEQYITTKESQSKIKLQKENEIAKRNGKETRVGFLEDFSLKNIMYMILLVPVGVFIIFLLYLLMTSGTDFIYNLFE